MPPATSSSVLRRLRDEGDSPTIRTASPDDPRSVWRDAFRAVRAETERRAALLSPEDQVVQSMPDASPTKWHRAHTTWFLEQFLLAPRLAGLSRVQRTLRLSLQLLLCRGRPAPGAPATRAAHAAGLRRRHRLPGPRRRSGRAVARGREGIGVGRGGPHSRDRSSSRAAASGVAAHRHPARVRAKSRVPPPTIPIGERRARGLRPLQLPISHRASTPSVSKAVDTASTTRSLRTGSTFSRRI